MRTVLRIVGFIILYTIGTALLVACLVLFSWVWAILVLTGKIKLGPPALWNDQTARHDFNVRKVELKMAGGLLACYVSAVIIAGVVLSGGSAPFEGTPQDWIQVALVVPAFLVLVVIGVPLVILWSEDWRRTRKSLESRLQVPVLF